MPYTCSNCGKEHISNKKYPNKLCQSCYNYFRRGGKINPIPPVGVIKRDNRGYVICHICGMSYKRLGSHLKESHDMTIKDYKEKFGLCNNARTTEASYSQTMRDHAFEYGMGKRLLISGFNTRIKKGENDKRKGKKVRLQEIIDKKKRGVTH